MAGSAFGSSPLSPDGSPATVAAPVYDPQALHIHATAQGDAAVTGDLAGATAHLGSSDPAIYTAGGGDVAGSVALTGAGTGGPFGWPAITASTRAFALVPNGAAGGTTDVVEVTTPDVPAVAFTLASTSGMAPQAACLLGASSLVLSLAGSGGGAQAAFEVWDLSPLPGDAPTLVVAQPAETAQLAGGVSALGACCVAGRYLVLASATACTPGLVWVYDLAAPAAPVLVSPSAGVSCAGGVLTCRGITQLLSGVGAELVVCDDQGTVFALSLADPTAPRTVGVLTLGAGRAIAGAVALADGAHVAVALNDTLGRALAAIALIDLSDPGALRAVAAVPCASQTLAGLGRSSRAVLACIGSAGTVAAYDCCAVTQAYCFGGVAVGDATQPLAVVPLPDGTHAAVAGGDGMLRVLTLPTLTTYPVQMGAFAATAGHVTGALSAASLASTSAATARGRTLLEGGAVSEETIAPDHTLLVYAADGTAYKVPCLPA